MRDVLELKEGEVEGQSWLRRAGRGESSTHVSNPGRARRSEVQRLIKIIRRGGAKKSNLPARRKVVI